MSKILNEEIIAAKLLTLRGIRCDKCQKVILPKFVHGEHRNGDSKYFKVTTGHNDWGNDSPDSIETHDICPERICKVVNDYLENAEGSEYINIETNHVYEHMVRIRKCIKYDK